MKLIACIVIECTQWRLYDRPVLHDNSKEGQAVNWNIGLYKQPLSAPWCFGFKSWLHYFLTRRNGELVVTRTNSIVLGRGHEFLIGLVASSENSRVLVISK